MVLSIFFCGDFDVTFDPNLDCSGGTPAKKDSFKCIQDMCLDYDVIDIWRVRNPDTKLFTWRQRKPFVQRRLDLWLISDACQDDVEDADIIPSINSDHSAIVLHFSTIEKQNHGPSYWKFNSSLTNDTNYVTLINQSIPVWLNEFKDVTDKRVLWDLIKYRVRQVTIKYSKERARERREKLSQIETLLKQCEDDCSTDPTSGNIEKLEMLKGEYNSIYEYLSQGAIIRSRATWYEKGEKSNKFFLSLECHKKSKSSVRKIFSKDDYLISDPKRVMKEIECFYADLYKEEELIPSANVYDSFLKNQDIPKLSYDDASICEGRLTNAECFRVLHLFDCNKSPGNDGLTVEFYRAFWDVVGDLVVGCLNSAYEYGQLSNSQKQAIITLLEKKDKDKRNISNWRPISLINVDVKIGSKAIARRLETVLPQIRHHNDQSAYVKGRTVFDTVRAIEDILEYTETHKINGKIIAIDFQKAFDSVSRNFIFEALSVFN